MKTDLILALLSIIVAATPQVAAKRTLVPRTGNMELVTDSTVAMAVADTTGLPPFNENAVTLRGFNKRVSDNYETFFVQNNTRHHISGITVTLRYTDTSGTLLHERTLHIPCDLQPGKSRQVSVNSFDRQHLFYYYLSGKPRISATPFQVSARLMGYDIPIRRPTL